MAGKVSGPKGDKFDLGQNSEINVTPLVDIMLVLLIIFMVSAPMATVAIKVDLPPAQAPKEKPKKEPTFISIQKNGGIYIIDNPTSLGTLGADLAKRFDVPNPKEETVMIRADKEVRYEDFMGVVNQLQVDGYFKVGLINEDLS
jgi:biopolymer transport protein ExbD